MHDEAAVPVSMRQGQLRVASFYLNIESARFARSTCQIADPDVPLEDPEIGVKFDTNNPVQD